MQFSDGEWRRWRALSVHILEEHTVAVKIVRPPLSVVCCEMILPLETYRETSSEREFSALHDARPFMCLRCIESSDSHAFLRTAILFERENLFCETCGLIRISTVPLDNPGNTHAVIQKR
jgi:hypothetical protein